MLVLVKICININFTRKLELTNQTGVDFGSNLQKTDFEIDWLRQEVIKMLFFKKSWIKFIFLLISSLYFMSLVQAAPPSPPKEPEHTVLSVKEKRPLREELLSKMLAKYYNNKTFEQVHQYMLLKYQTLHKKRTPRYPDTVIKEALDKSRNLFDKVRPYVGNSFKGEYQPETIEKSINKYLWLKGICFLVLGISDEHEIALSYFYLPENETAKKDFMREIVLYSYPEVKDIPANEAWFAEMEEVMGRIAYKIFSISKYIKQQI